MSDPKQNSREKFDAEFDAFLHEDDSRIKALYRKLPHPEPDAELDARVRAQARRVLRDGGDAATTQTHATTSTHARHARRWLPAFGAAATLVLVAGLAWRLMPPATPTREAPSVADTATSAVAQSEPAAPAPAASPAQPMAPQASADATAQFEYEPHRTIAAKPESPAAADKIRAEAKPAANGAVAAAPKISVPTLAAPPGSAEASAFPPRVIEQPHAKSAPAPAAAAAPPPPAPASMMMEAETARAESTAAAPAPREAASADRAASPQAFADGAAAGGSPLVIRSDPSAPARYRWEIADGATPARGVYPPDSPPLRAWVEIVRTMLRDGHREEAKQALADLRRNHPDFRVPADLRGLE